MLLLRKPPINRLGNRTYFRFGCALGPAPLARVDNDLRRAADRPPQSRLRLISTDEELQAALYALEQRPDHLRADNWPGALKGLDSSGLYSWWVDKPGAQELSSGLGLQVEACRIYVGQTGATAWPSGTVRAVRDRRPGDARRRGGPPVTHGPGEAVAVRPVTCEVLNLDRYKRLIAICAVDGHDLGEAMLAIGRRSPIGSSWPAARSRLDILRPSGPRPASRVIMPLARH
jgi:hypothetical protein